MRALAWPAIAVSTAVLVCASVSSAAETDLFVDLTNALQRAADVSNRRAIPPLAAKTLTQDVSLLGVVIAGETRLALIGRAGGSELLPVGASLGGYRLIDVEENQATLESLDGERVVLRLQSGSGAGTAGVPTQSTGQAERDAQERR
jgi:hypothetical protein